MTSLPSEIRHPKVSGFLKDPQSDAFLVPTVWAEEQVAALEAAGFATEQTRAAVGLFVVPATLIRLPDRARALEAVRLVYPRCSPNDCEVVVAMRDEQLKLIPIVLPKPGEQKVAFVKDMAEEKKMKPKDVRRRKRAERAYRPILLRLAQLSRTSIYLHIDKNEVHAPLTAKPGEIHIYPACAPPGHTDTEYIGMAFGLDLHEEGRTLLSRKPTEGRVGDVLCDEDGVKLIQRLSSQQWYVLIPLFTFFFAPNSTQVFEKLMALAWNNPFVPMVTRKPATAKQFVETVTDWDDDYLPVLEKAYKDGLALIDKLQKELEVAHAGVKRNGEYLQMAKDKKRKRGRKARVRENFRQLTSHPLVERVELDQEELMIYTRPIVGTHEGVSYDFGAFVLRVDNGGYIAVWNENPTHPKGVPHPHISLRGVVCYGNATQAITKATGELRFADAVTYVLRWLSEGYEESLAAVKIEEWPRTRQTPSEGGEA